MSTRSCVGQEYEDGTVRMIYVHCDGSPDWIGPILFNYYSGDKLQKLLDLGALDSIGRTIETCKAFHRDFGGTKQVRIVETVAEAVSSVGVGIVWVYIRRKNGEWEAFDRYNRNKRLPLLVAIDKYSSKKGATMVEIWKSEGKAETILTILRTRFNKVPLEVEDALCAMTSPMKLDSWAAQAATCQSMEEFAEALRKLPSDTAQLTQPIRVF